MSQLQSFSHNRLCVNYLASIAELGESKAIIQALKAEFAARGFED